MCKKRDTLTEDDTPLKTHGSEHQASFTQNTTLNNKNTEATPTKAYSHLSKPIIPPNKKPTRLKPKKPTKPKVTPPKKTKKNASQSTNKTLNPFTLTPPQSYFRYFHIIFFCITPRIIFLCKHSFLNLTFFF